MTVSSDSGTSVSQMEQESTAWGPQFLPVASWGESGWKLSINAVTLLCLLKNTSVKRVS